MKPVMHSRPKRVTYGPKNGHPRKKRVTVCPHVIDGAVWCSGCARTRLTQATEMKQKAFTQSGNPDVHAAALVQYRDAVKMFSLTDEGLNRLDKSYVNMVASGDMVTAQKILHQIGVNKKERSVRNQEAKVKEKKKLAQLTTMNSATRYGVLPKLVNGSWDVKNVTFVGTSHFFQRIGSRKIDLGDVLEAFYNHSAVKPDGNGHWLVSGKNGVVVPGTFVNAGSDQEFLAFTVYTVNDNDDERKFSLQNM